MQKQTPTASSIHPMPWCAAARARGGAEFGAGLARVGGLDDPAVAAEGFGGQRAVGTVGQGFRAVHFIEMGFVDFGGRGAAAAAHPAPRVCGAQAVLQLVTAVLMLPVPTVASLG